MSAFAAENESGKGAIIFVREGREGGLASKEEEEEYDVFMKQ